MNRISSPFVDELLAACSQKPAKIALPESDDLRVLSAAHALLNSATVEQIYLFGDRTRLLQRAEQAGCGLKHHEDKLRWIPESDPNVQDATLHHLKLQAMKRGKRLEDRELELVSGQRLDQSAYLLATNSVDAVVAGCVHTTAEVIRAALRGVGLATGCKTVSSSFAMIREGGPWPEHRFVFADCGVVVEPNAEQLADIACASVTTFRALFPNEEPVIAFLSFSTKGSASHPSLKKMQEALAMFQKRMPTVVAEGELQFDAAYDRAVGEKKAPGNLVSGRANCFLFPDLNAGNIAYKMCQRLAGFAAFGPILQGTAKPYADLSRGATAHDIMVSALIAMLRARTEAQRPS